jgi:phospholipid/cholesterol/gamma-HCH transport system permease protein
LGLLIAAILGIGDSMQAKTQATVLIAHQFIVSTIFKFGILDLYPFILGLVLAGKIGSSVAAEIGSMQITGQIDALKTMSIRPVSYLGWPRVAASMIMFPLITIISDVFAMVSLSLVSLYVYAWVSYADLVAGLRANFSPAFLVTQMVLKPAFFGFFICFIGYFFGSRSRRGAKGVGQASVQAAVVSALAILFLNYIIGELSY